MLKNTTTTYGSIAKLFHWTVFLLVTCMLIAGYFMGDITNKPLRSEVISIHKLVGLFILTLMVLRGLWAYINIKPALPSETPIWQLFAEHLCHRLLYVFLILMPLSGWVMSVAAGYAPKLGSLALSLPIAKNKPLSSAAFDVHGWLAIGIITVVSIHVAAALYHYFVKKDEILQRMM